MILKNIKLKNFRNYETLKLDLNPNVNIFIGDNGEGKTNILEAIYYLSMTKSHKSIIDENLIMNNKTNFILEGSLLNNDIIYNHKIKTNKLQKKIYIDNNIIKKLSLYIINMNIILFSPDDLDLIKSSPSIRRKFLDIEIGKLSSSYTNILNEYKHLLKMRNEYLKNKTKFDNDYFNIITSHLIEKLIYICKARINFIDDINLIISNKYEELSNLSNLKLKYKTDFEFDINEDENILKSKLQEMFNKNLKREKNLGNTIIGPHRDDFLFVLNELDVNSYYSQGQIRLAVLALKLSVVDLLINKYNIKPILLLDDIFSELDDNKKNNIIKYLNNDIQIIITTTNLNNIHDDLLKNSVIHEIKNLKA